MTPSERMICARLKLFRENIGLAQDAFAERIGISNHQLASIEYGRTPLRYDIAWRVREVFGLAISWLFSGKYPPDHPDLTPWPNPATMEERRCLLTEAEKSVALTGLDSPAHKAAEAHWWKVQKEKSLAWEPSRAVLLAAMKSNLMDWLSQIPNAEALAFCSEISECAENFLNSFLSKPQPKLNLRTQALFRSKMHGDIENHHAGGSDKIKTQSALDIGGAMDETSVVQAKEKQIISLPELLHAVRGLVKERGTKTALARRLKVSRQAVDQWLSEDAKPSADLTFELLKWVKEVRERQK